MPDGQPRRPARSPLTLCPAKPSRAGRRVSETTTITATVSEQAIAIAVTIGIPAIARPRIAIITVIPANSTAEPDVANARPAASSTSIPWSRCSRWRVTMNRA